MLCLLGMCLRVILSANALFVPDQMGQVAQMPNVPALVFLAHNDLSGAQFPRLVYGDRISFNGESFTVTETLVLQAVTPDSVHSEFIDVESGARLSALDAWNLAYNRPGALVLQTCVKRGDSYRWGRMFVIARPRDR